MRVLVLNCGSSSIKSQLIEMPAARPLAHCLIERVGREDARFRLRRSGSEPVEDVAPCPDHWSGIQRILDFLGAGDGVSVDAVGHRVVHAGEAFSGSVAATDEVIAALEACSKLAPLHNPPNLAGIRACLAALPGVPNVCVFDTALHQSLPPEVFLYGLPYRFYEQHRIRRYGFHGVALRSVAGRVEELLGRPASELRMVMLMLGSGCTACALDHGRSIAVSTGFTPLEGLVQGTRCGDLDPGVVLALLRAGYTPSELDRILNRESGLAGLSGVGPDLRDIQSADTPDARLAVDLFVRRAIQYVGGYTADLGGLDVLAFGGGIGQNAAEVRARICEPLAHLGVELDQAANAATVHGAEGVISAPAAAAAVVVAAVDEEQVIAADTYQVVRAVAEQQATALR